MALFPDLGYFKLNLFADEAVEGMAFPQINPFGGDVFGKLSVVDLPACLHLRFPDAPDPQHAHLPVPWTAVGIALHAVFRQGDRGYRKFYGSLFLRNIYR